MNRRMTDFAIQVLCALGALVALAAYPLARYGNEEMIVAAGAGAALATANVLAGYLAIHYSAGRSQSTFLKAVLGGMAIRMGVMLVTVIVLVKVFHLLAWVLVVSLFGCYAVYLVLEVLFVQKNFSSGNH